MQIAGANCKICGETVVLATEGKFCAHCDMVVHLACDSGLNCKVCGEPYKKHEIKKRDPLGDALLSPSMRAGRNGAPALVIFLLIPGFLVILVLYLIMEALSHGHWFLSRPPIAPRYCPPPPMRTKRRAGQQVRPFHTVVHLRTGAPTTRSA